MRDLRRLVSGLVIVSFSVAALLGIVALLSSGSFSDTESNVLATTFIVGVASVAALCYLALAGHRFAAVGAIGGLTSVVATGLALWLTWGHPDGSGPWRAFGVSVALAASLAQASLLLALVRRRSLRGALAATLLAVAVVAVMIIVPIVGESGMSGGYWRAFGVVAILDVLGTVVVAALAFFGGGDAGDAAAEALVLTTDVQDRVVTMARELGTSPSQLVSDALDAFVVR